RAPASGREARRGPAAWIAGVLKQERERAGRAIEVIPDHIAHQPDEHEVHRVLERLADGEDAPIVRAVEVAEGVEPAAGEERFARARRVAALQRRLEHRLEAAIGAARGAEILDGPRAQAVARVGLTG